MRRSGQLITDARLRVLRRWWVWTQFYGVQPSYRELGAFCGVRSTNTVSEHLSRLVRDGWLRRDPDGQQRALSITPQGRALLDTTATPVVAVPWVKRQLSSG